MVRKRAIIGPVLLCQRQQSRSNAAGVEKRVMVFACSAA
jgi:hypothetical protein